MTPEFLAQYGTELIILVFGIIILVRDFARAQVKEVTNRVDDRALELQMQGLWLETSKRDRDKLDRVETESSAMQKQLHALELQLAREQTAYLTKLEKERESHRVDIDKREAENVALREQVRQLQNEINELRKRVEDVEAIANENALALKAEKELRITIEQERDALRAERDQLQVRVDMLTKETASNQASLDALKQELDPLKAKLDKDDGHGQNS